MANHYFWNRLERVAWTALFVVGLPISLAGAAAGQVQDTTTVGDWFLLRTNDPFTDESTVAMTLVYERDDIGRVTLACKDVAGPGAQIRLLIAHSKMPEPVLVTTRFGRAEPLEGEGVTTETPAGGHMATQLTVINVDYEEFYEPWSETPERFAVRITSGDERHTAAWDSLEGTGRGLLEITLCLTFSGGVR